MSKNLVAPFLF